MRARSGKCVSFTNAGQVRQARPNAGGYDSTEASEPTEENERENSASP